MTRTRLACIAILCGLILSVTTGITPAGASWENPAPTVDTYTESFGHSLDPSKTLYGLFWTESLTNRIHADAWHTNVAGRLVHTPPNAPNPPTDGNIGTLIFYGNPSSIKLGCNAEDWQHAWGESGICESQLFSIYNGAPGAASSMLLASSYGRCTSLNTDKLPFTDHGWTLASSAIDNPGKYPSNSGGNGCNFINTYTKPGGAGFGLYLLQCNITGLGYRQPNGQGCLVDDIVGMGSVWCTPTTQWAPVRDGGISSNASVLPPGSQYGYPAEGGTCGTTPDPTAFAPHLSCGRTMRDMGNGQWFADVEAIVRNPDPEATDTGHWKVSWTDETYTGRTATIPLPPGASTEENLWVSYWNTRTTDEVIGWSQAQETGSEWYDGMEVHSGTPFVHSLPGAWLLQGLLGGDGEPETVGAGWMAFDVDGDGVVGDVIPSQPITQVKKATAVCTVRVSPVTMNTDPDVVIINMPAHPDDGEPATGTPPPPGSVDGDAACGGGSWWNPVTWAKSVFCKLGDLWSLLRELLDWLMDQLGDFTIPGISGLPTEWSNKFPLSVVTEAVSAFGAIDTALDSGMGDSCGPTFDPDVSALTGGVEDTIEVSLPSPNAECNQSEFATQAADLGGYRTPLRSFFVVVLWAGFFVKVAHSIGPGRSGIEPTDGGTP